MEQGEKVIYDLIAEIVELPLIKRILLKLRLWIGNIAGRKRVGRVLRSITVAIHNYNHGKEE